MSTPLSPHVPVTGPELRAAREALGWSQAVLAACLGVRQATVSRWETAELPIRPPMARLIRLVVDGPWLSPAELNLVNKELQAQLHATERRTP